MQTIFEDFGLLSAFWMTLKLTFWSAIFSLIIGTIVAIMRLSPVAVLQRAGAAYVTLLRNTPLTLIMIFASIALFGQLGLVLASRDAEGGFIATNNFRLAILALSVYHAAFVCEAIRSGVNTIPVGQAEAARSIGLGFGQSLREVILPQAFRGAIAPLGSVIIALIKNSTVAAVIGVGDSAGLLQVITENEGASLPTFFFFAMVFVILTLPIGLGTTALSRKLVVKR